MLHTSGNLRRAAELVGSEESKNITSDTEEKKIGFEELDEVVSTDVENTVSDLKAEYEKLVTS